MSVSKREWKLLGSSAMFELRGVDAVRYLNGQVTQNVGLLGGEKLCLPTAVTDARGKLQFRAWLTQLGVERLGIWVEEGMGGDEVEMRLGRYLIADDAELLVVKGGIFHVLGEEVPVVGEGMWVREASRLGEVGWDVWFFGDFSREMVVGWGEEMAEDEWETRRIFAGVPRWGREMRGGELPSEVGLAETDLHFHKGCYIGQEVISRLKASKRWDERWKRRVERVELGEDQRVSGVESWEDEVGVFSLTSLAPCVAGDGKWYGLGIRVRVTR